VSGRHAVLAVALLWLAGNALRLPILAVPPVLATVQADLAMSGTQVGILSGLPVTLFALAALPGSLLIARIGAMPALVAGLLIAALGSGLRLFVPDVTMLYAATIVMAAGIAVMQPALPAVVRQWLPDRVGFATAVFTNGLIVGEIVPVATMTPIVLPLLDGDWRGALAFWALPLVAIALLIVALAPRSAPAKLGATIVRPHWWPDWHDGLVWRLGLMVGGVNGAYFGVNAFLPAFLKSVGRADLIPEALTALNIGQLPASFLLLAFSGRLERRGWPFVAAGLISVGCIVGMVATGNEWVIVFACILGFFAGGTLVLMLALPPLLKESSDIARTSAGMFAMGYAEALLSSVLGGVLWDLTGIVAFAFLPIAVGVLPLLLLPRTIRFGRGDTLAPSAA
jgi:CP family cyanate transporter-like MFS transporter